MGQPWMQAGDTDRSGDLSGEELRGLGERWWAGWDVAKAGSVTQSELAEGLNRTMGGPVGGGGPFGFGGGTPQRLRPSTTGGPSVFGGPGVFLAPAIMAVGDGDRDGRLTRVELTGLIDGWSKTWDRDHDGRITADEIGEGLSQVLPPPPGFPGGGGPGPGGPPAGGPR